MSNHSARDAKFIHIADLALAKSARDGRSTWEALLEALEQAYELGVSNCIAWVREAEGDSVATDLSDDFGGIK